MGKNPHPPRQGGANAKKGTAPKTDDGELQVVFSNAKDNKKSSNAAGASHASASDSKAKDKGKKSSDAPPGADDAPKKPDTRTLIAGSSWTGKLPVNLLSEHCQKQKWDRPEYTMTKTPSGFLSTVILRSRNQKTQEVVQLPRMKVPPSHEHLAMQPSAVEARHFAATWALFRFSSGKNIHMMLPPQYKDLWKGPFQDIKREDLAAGKDGLYASDPFQALKEHEEVEAQRAKKRQAQEKERAAREAQQASGAPAPISKDQMRGWNTAPKIDMGSKIRREVESLAKQQAIWNPNATKLPKNSAHPIIQELTGLGFRKSHVQEAIGICKDREETLEWLLIHVPEDDLPKWSLPEGYSAGVSMVSSNMKREAAIKRLSSGGYATELCQDVLDRVGTDEARAAQIIQDTLINSAQPSRESSQEPTSDEIDPWAEEQVVLESIFEKRYRKTSSSTFEVKLDDVLPQKSIALLFRKPTTCYPVSPPIMSVIGPLPAYIRLSITKKAIVHAMQNFLGDQMIFNIIDWVEHEISDVVENPGRLTEISSVSSGGAPDAMDSEPLARTQRPRKHRPKAVDLTPGTPASKAILNAWERRQQSPEQQKMIKVRKGLPAWSLQEAVTSAVNSHQVTIISGETGSGKSTQSVQFILDDMVKRQIGDAARFVCTQPRRISALGLADRVAEERCSAVGQEVGYSIRGESKQNPNTRITFCTTGVLLRRLQTSGGSTDDVVAAMADISHVFVDEVHERSLDTDFLLALLRDVLKRRKDLKVILMSATLDANVFETYFGGSRAVAKVEIQGRAFPVDDYYLDDVVRMTGFNGARTDQDDEDNTDDAPNVSKSIQAIGMGINYNLLASLVRRIDSDLSNETGGILIFLPGTLEINRTLDALRALPNIHALPLHASLLPAEQRRVFPAAPSGMRKVIAATNVAETSITIPDIVAVIDTGRVKETRYDAVSSMVKLEEVWASRAACKQRRGRAGRVRAGKCYKLFTRAVETDKMAERPDPEIRRVPLEQLCLSVKAMGVPDVPKFLQQTLTPPESVAVDGALTRLRTMGALDGDTLTALGQHMAMVPADLRCAKLMVYGALFGCLEASVTIASILTVRSPFVSPQDKREEAKAARAAFGSNVGDAIVDMRAFDAWYVQRSEPRPFREMRQWCEANFLSNQTLQDISTTRSQYVTSLKEIGFLPLTYSSDAHEHPLNRNATSLPLLHALLLSALHPNTLRILYPPQKYTATASGTLPIDPSAREIKLFDPSNSRVFIHPSSTLFSAQTFPSGRGTAPFLSYFTKVETSKVFVRDVAPAGTMAMLLFGGAVEVDGLGRGVVAGGWARVRGWARIGVLAGRLRGVLDRLLAEWIEDPGAMGRGRAGGGGVVDLVRRLVEFDGLDA